MPLNAVRRLRALPLLRCLVLVLGVTSPPSLRLLLSAFLRAALPPWFFPCRSHLSSSRLARFCAAGGHPSVGLGAVDARPPPGRVQGRGRPGAGDVGRPFPGAMGLNQDLREAHSWGGGQLGLIRLAPRGLRGGLAYGSGWPVRRCGFRRRSGQLFPLTASGPWCMIWSLYVDGRQRRSSTHSTRFPKQPTGRARRKTSNSFGGRPAKPSPNIGHPSLKFTVLPFRFQDATKRLQVRHCAAVRRQGFAQ